MFLAVLGLVLSSNISKQKAFLRYKNNVLNQLHIDSNTIVNKDSLLKDSVYQFALKWLKKPYCYGSKPPACFDCSGFVQYCFNQVGKKMPHSSSSLAFIGKFVSFAHARKGDLIFFTGRNSQSESVGHVGIVREYKDGKIHFIHASVKAGVIESNSQEEYYKKRVLFIKRIKLD